MSLNRGMERRLLHVLVWMLFYNTYHICYGNFRI
jgi:hypothetical protein